MSRKQLSLMSCIEAYATATAHKFYFGDQGDKSDVAKATAEYNIAAHNLRRALAQRPPAHAFALGDVVKLKSSIRVIPTGLRRARGEELIITDSQILADGTMDYGVNGNAWYAQEMFTLVSRAIPATLKKAYTLSSEEDEDEEL